MINIESVKNNPLKTAATILVSGIGLVTAVFAVDDRYVKVTDFATQGQAIENIQEQSQMTIDMIKSQMHTRKIILEMKEAERDLKPYEKVELDNLKKALKE